MPNIRFMLLNAIRPITKLVGKLHLSPSHRLMKSKDFWKIARVIHPGDVLVSRMKGELTNFFIPGYWSHAAIYVGDEAVIEAVGEGVIETDIIDFLLSKDYVAVLRPTFPSWNKEDSIRKAKDFVGFPYDYFFDSSSKSFFCSELVASCLGTQSEFTKRKTLGQWTVVAQDFYDAKKKFICIWEKTNANT